ncbi:hypothetical protein AN639_13010 [Candidatus Epulonipiscium fishelsonii]|uniref:Uncharacterized protein n=1 Tax=Candidatus Epulonipiscium fishelsonii TaxID=77094 RepID=A0ACC8X8X1_9FIRM|nr:hypothetical protein AN396_10755 [Epulopiscium sp. SCG-B11WGA-EpuloA1]ONI42131.1 hypothetical protein AN639_13010 [Epulopiscium sp. SCG-B05WGA-EpuloA1]
MFWNNSQVISCFTTREGGTSEGHFSSLNLGFKTNDDINKVRENYKILSQRLGIPYESMTCSAQVHETNIKQVTYEDRGNGVIFPNKWASVDGIYTTEKDIALVTHYADCVPLFFYAPKHHIIGLAHAGWRGTVNKIGEKMATLWNKEHNIPYEDIQVGIGPSIGPCCFEVHEDVSQPFVDTFGNADFIVFNENGKANIDLWECNKQTLQNLGIKDIQTTNICTCCNSDKYFSHRKTQGKRGLMGAIMYLK